jgi:hypothetical protein
MATTICRSRRERVNLTYKNESGIDQTYAMLTRSALVVTLILVTGLNACGDVGISGSGGSNTSGSSSPPPPAAVAPTITTQPVSQTVAAGNQANFAVAASGSTPLSFQWLRNGSIIAAATTATYTTPVTTSADNNATFAVTVSNSAGSVTSQSARLTVNVPPAITTQPASQTVSAGSAASFSVVASGSAPLSYQWLRNGNPIAAATAATYTIASTTAADNGVTFTVTVGDAAGSITSQPATLTVKVPPLPPPVVAPTITTQPASQSVTAGNRATFSVVASGSSPLGYQWQRNGSPITSATAATYTTPATSSSDNGASFTVTVSNSAGSVTSHAALLTVNAVSPMVGTDVVTYKNNLARTGANLTESVLTPAKVNATNFGKLRFLATDGKVDATPLYLSALSVAGSTHNVVFVATENDSVYAFDADSGATLWHVSLLGAGESPSGTHGCNQVTPTIGVTATPVIDRTAGAHGTLFVVAMSNNGNDHQRLHALDVTTGAELLGGPTEIGASYAAPGGGTRTFDPGQYEERAALLLSQGTLYTSWTSHCDNAPYTGWVIAYGESTLQQSGVLNIAPNGTGTGWGTAGPAIWMAGGGPAADSAGNVYLLAGNGAFETSLTAQGFPSLGDYGNSFVRIATGGGALSVADYFAMFNAPTESAADRDLGSGGGMLLPDLTDSGGTVRHLMVGAGKDGNLYVVNRDAMGKYSSSGNNIWQQLSGALGKGIWSTPAWFNGTLYYGPNSGNVLAFSVSGALVNATPSSSSGATFPYPGSAPSISANGTSGAILWAHENSSPGVLHAYDATNLANELYNSSQAAGGRDQFGPGNKFITPVIADGKVFVGTQTGVAVFGLLN